MTDQDFTSLSPSELEELAVLDAWGVLSGEDLEQFESAFAACNAVERARLRSIQEHCTQDLHDWSDGPAGLRERVLNRLQATMDLAGLRLAPLHGHRPRPRSVAFNAAWIWRMAALVLLAVSATLIVMQQATNKQYDKLLSEHTVLQALRTIETDLGTDDQATFIAMLRRPDVRHVYIVADQGSGLVRLAIDEQTGEAFVLAMDLGSQATPCTLELEDAQGKMHTLATLRTDRSMDAQRFELDVSRLADATIHLRSGDGTTIGSTLA